MILADRSIRLAGWSAQVILATACAEPDCRSLVSAEPVRAGTICRGDQVETSCQIANHGTRAVVLVDAASTCSCIRIRSNRTIVGAGETVSVPVTIDARRMLPGSHRRAITFTVDGSDSDRLRAWFEFQIVRSIEAEPSTLHLGDLFANEVRTAEIRLHSPSGEPVEVENVVASGSAQVVDWNCDQSILRVTLLAVAREGASEFGELAIRTRSRPPRRLLIPLHGRQVLARRAVQTGISFGVLAREDRVLREDELEFSSAVDAARIRVASDVQLGGAEAVTVGVVPEAPGHARVVVELSAAKVVGRFVSGVVHVMNDDHRVASIPFSAAIRR